MKTRIVWFGVVAAAVCGLASAQGQVPGAAMTNDVGAKEAGAGVALSPAAAEVVKLAQSGMQEDMLVAYVQGAKEFFHLNADSIVYLKDIGLTAPVLTAMLNRDKELSEKGTEPVVNQPGTGPPATAVAIAEPPVVTNAPPPAYVGNPPVEVSYFYNDLAPYGSWVVLPSYGWCWQPSVVVVNQGWRPYCDGGHWVFTTAGWYWESDYTWGWAPFHYGRWMFHDNCGWVWFPDTNWSPAWVTWRVAGDHCGWAPMPWRSSWDARYGYRFNGVSVGAGFDFGVRSDCFTFVAMGDFCDHDLRRRCLPGAQATRVFSSTMVVNNFSAQNGQSIVNGGLPAERVSQATRIPQRPVAIHPDRSLLKGGGVAVAGAEPAVYRRELSAPVKTGPIMAERIDERQPFLRHAELGAANIQRAPAMGGMTPGGQGTVPGAVPGGMPGYPSQYPAGGLGMGRGQGQTVSPNARRGMNSGMPDNPILESPKSRSLDPYGGRYGLPGQSIPGGPTQLPGGGVVVPPQTPRGQQYTPRSVPGTPSTIQPGTGSRSGQVIQTPGLPQPGAGGDVSAPRMNNSARRP